MHASVVLLSAWDFIIIKVSNQGQQPLKTKPIQWLTEKKELTPHAERLVMVTPIADNN